MARRRLQPDITTVSLAITGLFLLVLCVWPLLSQPWIFTRSADLDINSGKLRHQTHVFSVLVSEDTEESILSREVRRLGIQTPATPVWKRMIESYLMSSKHIDYTYGRLFAMSGQLLTVLDLVKASDDEGHSVIERLMSVLQSGDSGHADRQILLLMAEIGDRHDMEVLTPQAKSWLQVPQRKTQEQAQRALDVNEPVN